MSDQRATVDILLKVGKARGCKLAIDEMHRVVSSGMAYSAVVSHMAKWLADEINRPVESSLVDQLMEGFKK